MRFHYLSLCGLLFLSQVTFGDEHWDQWQVAKYVKSSELQRRSAWQLIAKAGIQRDDTILDIGCGDGRTAAWMALLASSGSTLCVDPNQHMLEWGRKQYDVLEFPNLSFREGSYQNIKGIPGEFSLITGFLSFHLISPEERDSVISDMYQKLKPNGRTLLVIPPPDSSVLFSKAIAKAKQSKKWRNYFSSEKPQRFFWENTAELKVRFSKVFKDVDVSLKPSMDPFVSRDDFAEWIAGTMPFVQSIPVNERENFTREIVDTYASLDPSLVKDSVFYPKFGRIEVVGFKRDI